LESGDGAVVRELASIQCGPGVITGLSMLFRFSPCSTGFSAGFPPQQKSTLLKFQFDLETAAGGMCHCKFLLSD